MELMRVQCNGAHRGRTDQTLTRSVFIVVAEVCADGAAELQDVVPLVLVHPFVLGLLRDREARAAGLELGAHTVWRNS